MQLFCEVNLVFSSSFSVCLIFIFCQDIFHKFYYVLQTKFNDVFQFSIFGVKALYTITSKFSLKFGHV